MSQKTNSLDKVRQLPVLGRLFLFLCCLLILWLPVAIPVFLIFHQQFAQKTEIILGIYIYTLFIWLIWFWGKYIEQKDFPYRYYGLSGGQRSIGEFFLGLIAGLGSLYLLMQLQVSFGWFQWQNLDRISTNFLPGLGVGIGVGFAEEVLFRGWLLTELDRDYTPPRSLWTSSIIYTLLHFTNWEVIRNNWLQFPGLLLLGQNFVLARRSTGGRLSMAIGLHGGLVFGYYLIDVGDLLISQDIVKPIVTGINGNPLAGLLGVIFLIGMGVSIRQFPKIITKFLIK